MVLRGNKSEEIAEMEPCLNWVFFRNAMLRLSPHFHLWLFTFQFLLTGCTNPSRNLPPKNVTKQPECRQHVWGSFFIVTVTKILKPTACQKRTAALLLMGTSLAALKCRPPTRCWWWLMPPMVWNYKLRLLSGSVHITSNNTLTF